MLAYAGLSRVRTCSEIFYWLCFIVMVIGYAITKGFQNLMTKISDVSSKAQGYIKYCINKLC